LVPPRIVAFAKAAQASFSACNEVWPFRRISVGLQHLANFLAEQGMIVRHEHLYWPFDPVAVSHFL
jgi:hypothetical protein